MIVLAEAPELLPPSSSRDDIARSLEASRIVGAQIYTIPPDFSRCENAEGALWHIPTQPRPTPAVWLGYIPDFARYRAIYDAAVAKNIRLPNAPDEHLRAQEFDRAHPHLRELTPRSLTMRSPADCAIAAREIGFPMFLKGAVQSRKARGWRACVAYDEAELNELAAHLWSLENRARGRVIARELVRLRHARTHDEFPLGREYRVFVWRGEVLSLVTTGPAPIRLRRSVTAKNNRCARWLWKPRTVCRCLTSLLTSANSMMKAGSSSKSATRSSLDYRAIRL